MHRCATADRETVSDRRGRLWIQTRYGSRFGLLGAMARDIAHALARAGYAPAETPITDPDAAGAYLWLNFPPSIDAIPEPCRRPGAPFQLLQFFVDHPLALHPRITDHLAQLPNFTLALPCTDSSHLLRLRWPTLRHAPVLHGVRPEDVLDAPAIERGHLGDPPHARDIDILVAGSIHTEPELDRLAAPLPPRVRPLAEEVARLLVAMPSVPFEQAADLILAPAGLETGQWGLLAAVWRYATARANRTRRVALVRALAGLRVRVFGPPAWAEICAPLEHIEHAGEAPYDQVPALMRRARVAIAWGPTQFTHAFSERQLIAMASGCATLSDDRLLARSILGPTPPSPSSSGRPQGILFYDAARPESARAAAERLLANRDAAATLGTNGAAIVRAAHTWDHRVPALATLMGLEPVAARAAAA